MLTFGARLAPMSTYERCHAVYGGWSSAHKSRRHPLVPAAEYAGASISFTSFGPPHHQPATQAHHPVLDIHHPGRLPRVHDSIDRPPPVVAFDVRAEKPSDVPPGAATKQPTGDWQSRARVGAPRGKPG